MPKAQPFDHLGYYHCDHLGTPQEITDEEGNIAWQAQYKAWGEAKVVIEKVRNPLRFQGQYFDHETGLHYNRFRYYDPEIGRYLSKDPIGFAGGLNLHAYVANPVQGIDPLGLQESSPSQEDIKRAQNILSSTVDNLVVEGKRFRFSGKISATINNVLSNDGYTSVHDFFFGPNGKEYGLGNFVRCYGQAETLLGNLNKAKENGEFKDQWKFRIVDKPGHYWVRGQSEKGVVLDIDPWVNEMRINDPSDPGSVITDENGDEVQTGIPPGIL
jgi:RHS repeat-associated protein